MNKFKLLILFISIHTCLFAQNKAGSDSVVPVTIPGSQIVKINSSIVKGQEYVLHIHLPRNYSDSSKKFPVIYLLDSQWDFPLLTAISGEQYFDGFLPEVIIVGITWGGENPNYDQLRARDLTPFAFGQPDKFGNAANFLSFIKNELSPYLGSKYRINQNERTLVGSSFGGLFTLFAMFKETDHFKNFVMTSPAIFWDHDKIYEVEKEYFSKHKALNARLYMAVGALENVEIFNKMVKLLNDRNYTGLKMQTKVLENIGHSGTKPEGYTRGLQWSFQKNSVSITPAQLKPYVGSYLAGNDTVKVVIEKDELLAITNMNKVKLTPETPQDFYVEGMLLKAHFKKDKENKVTGFQMEFYGGETFVKKIK